MIAAVVSSCDEKLTLRYEGRNMGGEEEGSEYEAEEGGGGGMKRR